MGKVRAVEHRALGRGVSRCRVRGCFTTSHVHGWRMQPCTGLKLTGIIRSTNLAPPPRACPPPSIPTPHSWVPPPMTTLAEPSELDDRTAAQKADGSGPAAPRERERPLSDSERDRFEDMLRFLTVSVMLPHERGVWRALRVACCGVSFGGCSVAYRGIINFVSPPLQLPAMKPSLHLPYGSAPIGFNLLLVTPQPPIRRPRPRRWSAPTSATP